MNKDQVLVIDDEKEICFLLSNMLSKMGFEVYSANSISEGKEFLEEKDFKIIFLDLCLPDGIGFNLVPYIKNLNEEAKIIVITAYEGDWGKKRAGVEGAHYFLPKPFNKKMIMGALSEFKMTAIT